MICQRRALAVAVGADREHFHVRIGVHGKHADALVTFGQLHREHAAGGTPHRTHFVFVKAKHLAVAAEDHDVLRSVRDHSRKDAVVVVKRNGGLAHALDHRKFLKRRLLHHAVDGCKEHVVRFVKAAHRQNRHDRFAFGDVEQVHDRLALARTGAFRNLVDRQGVDAAEVAEAQGLVVAAGRDDAVDLVAFLELGSGLALTAATLAAVFGKRLALDVAFTGKRHHHRFFRHEVERIEVRIARRIDFRAAFIAELVLELGKFRVHDLHDALGTGKDVEQIGDLSVGLPILFVDLVLFQTGEFLQSHLQNLVGLHRTQVIQAVGEQTVAGINVLRTVVLRIEGGVQKARDQIRLPAARHELFAGNRRIGSVADDAQEFVEV